MDLKQRRAKDLRLKREFDTTLDEYEKIEEYQGGCGMCERPRSDFKNGHALDHDHELGLIRGLLCMLCNRLLGKIESVAKAHGILAVDLLEAAAEYMRNPPAVFVLGEARHTTPGRVGTKKRRALRRKASLKKRGLIASAKKGQNRKGKIVQRGIR